MPQSHKVADIAVTVIGARFVFLNWGHQSHFCGSSQEIYLPYRPLIDNNDEKGGYYLYSRDLHDIQWEHDELSHVPRLLGTVMGTWKTHPSPLDSLNMPRAIVGISFSIPLHFLMAFCISWSWFKSNLNNCFNQVWVKNITTCSLIWPKTQT